MPNWTLFGTAGPLKGPELSAGPPLKMPELAPLPNMLPDWLAAEKGGAGMPNDGPLEVAMPNMGGPEAGVNANGAAIAAGVLKESPFPKGLIGGPLADVHDVPSPKAAIPAMALFIGLEQHCRKDPYIWHIRDCVA